MSTAAARPEVDYVASAQRHHRDAELLLSHGRTANASQLWGLTLECGLKAILLAAGLPKDGKGSLKREDRFREHLPLLADRVDILGHLIPDGRLAHRYFGLLPGRTAFATWEVDQRYWHEDALAALPAATLPAWQAAAAEVAHMLDEALLDGVLP
ncbi:MAG: hypothetical protein RIQ53_2942 [Pseudomonadota bacterium]|jgi:hypothetical protein